LQAGRPWLGHTRLARSRIWRALTVPLAYYISGQSVSCEGGGAGIANLLRPLLLQLLLLRGRQSMIPARKAKCSIVAVTSDTVRMVTYTWSVSFDYDNDKCVDHVLVMFYDIS